MGHCRRVSVVVVKIRYVWIGPGFYFYFRSLTNDDFKFSKKDLWHFLPGAIYFSIILLTFIVDIGYVKLIAKEELAHHFGTQGHWSDFRQSVIDGIFNHLNTISIVIYIVLTTRI